MRRRVTDVHADVWPRVGVPEATMARQNGLVAHAVLIVNLGPHRLPLWRGFDTFPFRH